MKKNKSTSKYFLACECKPGGKYWSVLDPFAYDVKPAYIIGSLGVLSYNPETYAVIDIKEDGPPLLGYLCTITHEDTVLLLDKMKGYLGNNAFNMHEKVFVRVFTDNKRSVKAWTYLLSSDILDHYQQIEQIEFGLWDEDKNQENLLSRLEEDY